MKWISKQIALRLLLSISLGLAMGCNAAQPNQDDISPDSSTSGGTSTSPSPTTPAVTTTPLALSEAPKDNFVCDSPRYEVQVTWEQGQPRFTFTRKPNEITVNSNRGVAIARNSDGSLTYGYSGEITVYARVFPDNNCVVQAIDAQGNVTVEENGRKIGLGTSPLDPARTRYQRGYDKGYQQGFQDGQNAHRYNSGNNPDGFFQQGAQSGDTEYDRGFREGFYSGFTKGYESSENRPPNNEPNTDTLSMTCTGSIQDDVDFTVYYTREAGFNRVEFRPRRSNALLTSNPTYSGKNSAGQGVWRGGVNGMADAIVVHLSSAAPQPGDEISVSYDGRWGRGRCR